MGSFNERRGLCIPETGFSYLDEGVYGFIFVNKKVGKIIKVYKRNHREDHVRAIFTAEVDAYCIAAASALVSSLIPRNFKSCTINQIADRQGQNVTGEFFSELAFGADFVEGYFHRIGGVGSADALQVRDLFRKAGIHHTTDMSVTVSSDGKIIKCIDFATQEHELMHDE